MKATMRVFGVAVILLATALLCVILVLCVGKMDRTVLGLGAVAPEREVRIAPMIAGIVRSVRVTEGERLQAGDTLLVIGSEDAELEVERATGALADHSAELARAEEEYANLKASKAYEVGVILADVNEAERSMVFNERQLERARTLYDQGVISQVQLDKDRRAWEASASQYAVLRARSEVIRTQMERTIRQERRGVALAQVSLELARSRLQATVITSPVDGVVLTAEPEKLVGGAVEEGKMVLEIGCSGDLVFKAIVDESKVRDVRVGQRGRVFLSGYPYREYKVFEGEVMKIAVAPVAGGEQSGFAVSIRIKEPWVEVQDGRRVLLRYGLSGKVEIVVDPGVRLFWLLMGDLGGRARHHVW